MILVTGGTGLLGSQLVFDLITSGKEVKTLIRKNSSTSLLEKKFKNHAALFSQLNFIEGDVLDIFSLDAALENVTHVYHCAATVSFIPSEKDLMQKVNVEGTANLMNACLEKKIEKFCHVSSVAALGRAEENSFINEDAVWENSGNNSNYAISKYGAEREVWRGVAEGLNAVIINPTIIIGEGNYMTDSSAIISRVYNGLSFYTEGINGFVDVRDVSACMIKLMESEIKNERFVICSENKSYKEFLKAVAKSVDKKPPGIKASAWLSAVAWRTETVKTFFTNQKPLITKETAHTAQKKYFYSNEKIKKTIEINFIPVDESLKHWGEKFLAEKK